ncbi:MAG: VWA domain-containing protein, partial [Planctomycetes bacterium]|nr:VWA domain-containing protein [Planctomycetota bacterium]
MKCTRVQPPVVVCGLDVDITVEGPVAHILQKLTLRNPGQAPGEFDLLFPLGDESIISGVTLKEGGKTLEGTVMTRKQARAWYRKLTQQLRDPALLEHYGEALFRARVFPVPAGGTSELTLSYDRVLRSEGDLQRLHVPLTAFRRVAGPIDLNITGSIAATHAITTLYSPTHALDASLKEQPSGDRRFVATFSTAAKAVTADLDFVAYFKANPSAGIIDVSVLSERPDPKLAGYYVTIIRGLPQKNLKPEPRDVVFVLDRSGSMQGKKIEQAKAALKFLVERLGPDDRFNLVTYSSNVDVYAPQLTKGGDVSDVITFIDAVQPGGGTDIQSALAKALGQFDGTERTNQIIFLTDGLPTAGERDHRKISAHIKKTNLKGARVIAFGVGHDVNGAFLDRLAVQNHGLSEYVLPTDNIEEKVPGFYSRMQSPLLLDAEITIGGSKVYDVFPSETGDLYGGHHVVVTGRYTQPGDIKVVVTGRRGSERQQLSFDARLREGARPGSAQLVARIWATKKIGYLVDEIRLNGENKELVDEIVRLGTRFGILTEYTSFLAAPETDIAEAGANGSRALEEVRKRTGVTSGAHGVAQAANSKRMQRGGQAQYEQSWLGRNGRKVTIHGVQNLKGRTLFQRKETWLDATVTAEAQKNAVEVPYFSDSFFGYIERNPWLNQCIARTGDL